MRLNQFTVILIEALAVQAASSTLSQGARVDGREVPSSHTLHERYLPHWGDQWSKRHRLPGTAVLPVRIGLRQSNLQEGHDKLMDISNPRSPNYGKHMSAQEVIDFFAPSQSSVDAVKEWLVSAGIEGHRIGHSANKQWIQLDVPASDLERLLFTEYYVWEHLSGSTDVASEEYYIPQHVQDHVDYITPGVRLRPRTKAARPEAVGSDVLQKRRTHKDGLHDKQAKLPELPNLNASTCDTYVTAACVRAQYSIPQGRTASPGNELGIFESTDDHYSKADLDAYWSNLEPYIPNGTYPEERLVDGAIGAYETPSDLPLGRGEESDLDFQAAWPLIWPQKTVLFQEDDQWYEFNETSDDTPYVGFWNTFYDAIDGSYCTYSAYGETGDCKDPACLDPSYPNPNEPGGYKGALQCGLYKPTNVISMSYAFGENYLPAYYMKRQCDEVLKLSLQGVTVVASSGDGGVGGLQNCPGQFHQIFHPLTPNTCPYVLAVGSTQFDPPKQPGCKLEEVPTTRFGSGGGFSNVFATPDYQAEAVKHYFDTVTLNFTGYTQFVDGNDFSNVTSGLYHIGGRGMPDVAAVGDRFLIYFNGTWVTVGGTSVSAPIWGAILTLINEERLAAGKSTLGFVHPLLYAHPEVFHDITTGSNPGCNLTYSNGFPAAKGWDPVSGLGSPIYPKLRKALVDV
ncbi:subtilisin-like protein [Thozetella sp. PMI_491]|nr:subtilisin-like protein [Thozetella sp. PMI_491]